MEEGARMNWEKKPYGYTAKIGAWRFDICVGDTIPPHGIGILLVPPDTINTWDGISTHESENFAPSVKLNFDGSCIGSALHYCETYAAKYLVP